MSLSGKKRMSNAVEEEEEENDINPSAKPPLKKRKLNPKESEQKLEEEHNEDIDEDEDDDDIDNDNNNNNNNNKKKKKNKKNNGTKPKKEKPKKEKPAKPLTMKANHYLVGNFKSNNSVRMEFKALFGSNKLAIAWSDLQRNELQSLNFDFFNAFMTAKQKMDNMTTKRVEIDIDSIKALKISATKGVELIQIEIGCDYPPIFTEQQSSRPGKGSKFLKTKQDPTNGNAIKYKKHTIILDKKATANNLSTLQTRLCDGSQVLKKLLSNMDDSNNNNNNNNNNNDNNRMYSKTDVFSDDIIQEYKKQK